MVAVVNLLEPEDSIRLSGTELLRMQTLYSLPESLLALTGPRLTHVERRRGWNGRLTLRCCINFQAPAGTPPHYTKMNVGDGALKLLCCNFKFEFKLNVFMRQALMSFPSRGFKGCCGREFWRRKAPTSRRNCCRY